MTAERLNAELREAEPPSRARFAGVALWGLLSSALATVLVMFITLPRWNPSLTLLPPPPASELAAAPPAEETSARVLVVIVDGLSETHARTLPGLTALRTQGIFRPLVSHYPTFTSPNVVAMMTGMAPRDSGVRLNGAGLADRGLDSVLDAAAESGRVVTVNSRQFAAFANIVTERDFSAEELEEDGFVHSGRLRFVADQLLAPSRQGRRFDLVHIGEVDDCGHADGPEAASYATAATHADRVVTSLAASLDPARDVLVVLSDHGHIPKGGHGGDEPEAHRAFFLAAFGPVRHDVEAEPRPMRDVAPTLALLAGTRSLAHNQGAAMIDLFASPTTSNEAQARASFDRAATALCSDAQLGDCARLSELASMDLAASEAFVLALGAAHDAQRLDAEQRALGVRGVIAVALALAFAGVFAFRSRARRRVRLVLLVRAGFVFASLILVYAGYLGVLGYHVSLSGMAGTEYFLPDAAQASVLAVLGAIATAFLFERTAVTRALFPMLRLAQFMSVASVVLLWVYVGFDASALGPNRASTLLFLSGPTVVAASLAMLLGAAHDRFHARRGRLGA